MADQPRDETVESLASTRRGFLKVGGMGAAAAAAAAATAGVLASGKAFAANGNPLVIGQPNAGTSPTTLDGSEFEVTLATGTSPALFANQSSGSSGGGPGIGVQGQALNGTGVEGIGNSSSASTGGGIGVHAVGLLNAVALEASADSGPVAIVRQTTEPTPFPPVGTWLTGTMFVKGGHLWYCYSGGSPGKWAKLSGSLAPLNPSVRVYDSRSSGGALAPGSERAVTISQAAGATAVLVNLTVTGTAGAGFLGLFKNGTGWPGTSNINWFGPNQNLANNATVSVDGSGAIKVHAGGGQTHFIIDLLGIYP